MLSNHHKLLKDSIKVYYRINNKMINKYKIIPIF